MNETELLCYEKEIATRSRLVETYRRRCRALGSAAPVPRWSRTATRPRCVRSRTSCSPATGSLPRSSRRNARQSLCARSEQALSSRVGFRKRLKKTQVALSLSLSLVMEGSDTLSVCVRPLCVRASRSRFHSSPDLATIESVVKSRFNRDDAPLRALDRPLARHHSLKIHLNSKCADWPRPSRRRSARAPKSDSQPRLRETADISLSLSLSLGSYILFWKAHPLVGVCAVPLCPKAW